MSGFGTCLRYRYGSAYGSGSREPELAGAANELQLRVHAELRVHAGEVRLDRPLADEQRLRDLLRAHPGRGKPGDLTLAARQRTRPERAGRRAPPGAPQAPQPFEPPAPAPPPPPPPEDPAPPPEPPPRLGPLSRRQRPAERVVGPREMRRPAG